MTLTTLPSDKLVGFTTRFDRHHSPYKQALLSLKPNDPLTFTDSMGDLVLPLDDSIPLVFVAGGIAISSYVSMIRWLTAQNDKRDVTLLYAVRSMGDIIYTSDFDDYAGVGDLTRVLYTPNVKRDDIVGNTGVWPGDIGGTRLTAADVMKYVKPGSQIYLSGTEPMVEQLRQSLQNDFNIPQYRLVFDYFDGYTDL
jgi:ferredoxin-NADP reductase